MTEAAENPVADLTEDRWFPLGWGFLYRAVCAPASWSVEKISDEVSRDDPPGTSLNRWVVSDPDDTRTDAFEGCNCLQCPDDPNRRHWLMNC